MSAPTSPGEPLPGADAPRRRHHRTLLTAVLTMSAGVVLLLAKDAPQSGPVDPYGHHGFSEVSMASEDVVSGQTSTVATELESNGYRCIQARSNSRAVQVVCHAPSGHTQVDIVSDPDGSILYADIDLQDDLPDTDQGGRRSMVILAPFLDLWPQDRPVVQEMFADAVPRPFMPLGGEAPPVDPSHQYDTHDVRTEDAHWLLQTRYTGEALRLKIRTPRLRDQNWPLGGDHYATSIETAMSRMKDEGFGCEVACYRAADDLTVSFGEHEGQIITADFIMRSPVAGDPRPDSAGRWLRGGLPFLTPAVSSAVGQFVEGCRASHNACQGVIAGTPVRVITPPGAVGTPDGGGARELHVTIGIPLLDTSLPFAASQRVQAIPDTSSAVPVQSGSRSTHSHRRPASWGTWRGTTATHRGRVSGEMPRTVTV